MDCSQPGPSVHGISQARTLEWVAISFSRHLPDWGIKPASPVSPALLTLLPAEPSSEPAKDTWRAAREEEAQIWKERYRRKHLSWWGVYVLFFLGPKPYIFLLLRSPTCTCNSPLTSWVFTPKKLNPGLGLFKLQPLFQGQDTRVRKWEKIPDRDLYFGVRTLPMVWASWPAEPRLHLGSSLQSVPLHSCTSGRVRKELKWDKVPGDSRRI